MKSREEIEDLKQAWRKDPSWDIEETEGFEGYKEGLKAYRLDCEAKWKQKGLLHRIELADKICPMSLSGNSPAGHCFLEKCAWWSEYNEKCAVRIR